MKLPFTEKTKVGRKQLGEGRERLRIWFERAVNHTNDGFQSLEKRVRIGNENLRP